MSPHTALHRTSGGCGRAPCSHCLQGRSWARRMWLSCWTLPCWSWLQKHLWFCFFSFLLRPSLASAKGKQPFTPMYVGGFLSPSFVGSVVLCLLKNKMPSTLSKIPGFVTLFAFALESHLVQAGLLTYCVATDDLEFLILQLPISEVLGFQKPPHLAFFFFLSFQCWG